MGFLLSWLNAPEDVAQQDWADFLDSYSAFLVVILLATVITIVVGYRHAAQTLKVFRANDVFQRYTPMRWLLFALAGGSIAALVGGFQFHGLLKTSAGLPGFVCIIFLLSSAFSLVIAYLLIIFVASLTPSKFAYRPAPFLHKKGPAR